MELLVFSRILYPASKNETYNNKDIFFEKFDFSLKDLYRSLDHFETLKDDIIKSIWDNTKISYNRDTSITYYDTINYYFEKGSRKKGPSKEHRNPLLLVWVYF